MAKTPTQEDIKVINLQPLLTPIAIVVVGVILSVVNLIGFSSLQGAITNGGLVKGTTTAAANPPAAVAGAATEEDVKGLFVDGNLVFGNPDAKNLFVEFSDPSCPYCHVAGGLNPELSAQVGAQFVAEAQGGSYVPPVLEMKKMVDKGEAAFVWMYLNGHGNGELSTQALYCANDQGKFWEVHDQLMTNKAYDLINDQVKNDVGKTDVLVDFLKDVDKNALKDCLKSGKYAGRIASDQATGRALGVSGTPGFFVNGVNFAGAYSFTDMQANLR